MRLFLLPISTRRTLIYCERVQETLASPGPGQTAPKPPYTDRILNKASSTWASWEKAEKGWQKQITVYGNQLFKRIAFEEWGLKSFPPLTKAKLVQLEREPPTSYQCLYPSAFLRASPSSTTTSSVADKTPVSTSSITALLTQLSTERQALHTRRFWTSILLMPVSAPFTLVPVIPNLPFFYLCFRAYSHYRALYGARFLAHLLAQNSVTPTPSRAMDGLYVQGLLCGDAEETRRKHKMGAVGEKEVEEAVGRVDKQEEEVMLLKTWNGKVIAEEFGLPEMEVEIERAVWQVEKAVEMAKQKREEGEKKGAETVIKEVVETKR